MLRVPWPTWVVAEGAAGIDVPRQQLQHRQLHDHRLACVASRVRGSVGGTQGAHCYQVAVCPQPAPQRAFDQLLHWLHAHAQRSGCSSGSSLPEPVGAASTTLTDDPTTADQLSLCTALKYLQGGGDRLTESSSADPPCSAQLGHGQPQPEALEHAVEGLRQVGYAAQLPILCRWPRAGGAACGHGWVRAGLAGARRRIALLAPGHPAAAGQSLSEGRLLASLWPGFFRAGRKSR